MGDVVKLVFPKPKPPTAKTQVTSLIKPIDFDPPVAAVTCDNCGMRQGVHHSGQNCKRCGAELP